MELSIKRCTGHAKHRNGEAATLAPSGRYVWEIRDRGLESQSYRASGLTLLTAAISLWNTVYIERAIDSLKRKGIQLNEQLIAHLPPLGWEHINLSGDYVWRTNLKLG